MSHRRKERFWYELTEDKGTSYQKSLTTFSNTVEEYQEDNELVTKEVNVTTTWSKRPADTPEPKDKSIQTMDTDVRQIYQTIELLRNKAYNCRNGDDFREQFPDGQNSEHGFSVDMEKESKFHKGNTDCTTTEYQKIDTNNLSTSGEGYGDITDVKMKIKSEFQMGNKACEDDKEVDIQAEESILDMYVGRGKKSESLLKVDMEDESMFKLGNEDCKTKERQRIVTDKFVAEGTHDGESKSKTEIKMKKQSKFDMGDRKCEKNKEVEIQTKEFSYQGGSGLPSANININMENSSVKGLVQDSTEKVNTTNAVVKAKVESFEKFEEISKNHAGTVKKMSIIGNWIEDIDEDSLEDHFKEFHNLVDLNIQSATLSNMPPISCLSRLRSFDISTCSKISASSALREISCVKRPLKIVKMSHCSHFRFKELLEVALYLKNAEELHIYLCWTHCSYMINEILEKTNIQKLIVTRCPICLECTEWEFEFDYYNIPEFDRVFIA